MVVNTVRLAASQFSKTNRSIFVDSSRQDLSNDVLFDWFLGRPHFFIVFGNGIIMTSFLVT